MQDARPGALSCTRSRARTWGGRLRPPPPEQAVRTHGSGKHAAKISRCEIAVFRKLRIYFRRCHFSNKGITILLGYHRRSEGMSTSILGPRTVFDPNVVLARLRR